MRIQDLYFLMVGDVVLALHFNLLLWVCARLIPPSHTSPYDGSGHTYAILSLNHIALGCEDP